MDVKDFEEGSMHLFYEFRLVIHLVFSHFGNWASAGKCLFNYFLIATAVNTALLPRAHIAQTKAYIRTGIGYNFI